MAKASSPVRLQAELMQAATTAGQRQHRSAAEQVEYWASLGRSVANSVDPDSLLAVSAGLSRLKIEPVEVSAIDPDDVFAALESEREAGTLVDSVTSSSVRYQISAKHPGYLEQIAADGKITTGQFSNGVFTPRAKSRPTKVTSTKTIPAKTKG